MRFRGHAAAADAAAITAEGAFVKWENGLFGWQTVMHSASPSAAPPSNGFSPLIFNNDLLVNHYRRLLHPVAAAVPRLPNGANGYNDVPDLPLKMGPRAPIQPTLVAEVENKHFKPGHTLKGPPTDIEMPLAETRFKYYSRIQRKCTLYGRASFTYLWLQQLAIGIGDVAEAATTGMLMRSHSV
uniref:Uncharacterized protein n=1 Tax=Anopheles atroparvus TaxID=41427 RepID=A0A182IXS5_ANOAO